MMEWNETLIEGSFGYYVTVRKIVDFIFQKIKINKKIHSYMLHELPLKAHSVKCYGKCQFSKIFSRR